MRIELHHDEDGFPVISAEEAVIDVIRKWCKIFGYDSFIVRIKTTLAGVEDTGNHFLSFEGTFNNPDGDFMFDTDWYEGGEIELLGFIPIGEIEIPEQRSMEVLKDSINILEG